MVNSRRKGHDFERLVAKQLRAVFPNAHRGLQTHGARVPDVDGTGWWLECKTGRAVDLPKAFRQARGDAADADSVATHHDEWANGIAVVYRRFGEHARIRFGHVEGRDISLDEWLEELAANARQDA